MVSARKYPPTPSTKELVEDGYMGTAATVQGYVTDWIPATWNAESVVNHKRGKVISMRGSDPRLRTLQKDKDISPEEARDRLEISAETFGAEGIKEYDFTAGGDYKWLKGKSYEGFYFTIVNSGKGAPYALIHRGYSWDKSKDDIKIPLMREGQDTWEAKCEECGGWHRFNENWCMFCASGLDCCDCEDNYDAEGVPEKYKNMGLDELAELDIQELAENFDIGTLIELRIEAAKQEAPYWESKGIDFDVENDSFVGMPSGIFQEAIWQHDEYGAETFNASGYRYPQWRDCGCPEEELSVEGNFNSCYKLICDSCGPLDTICATQMRELLTMQPFRETIRGFRKLNRGIYEMVKNAETFGAEASTMVGDDGKCVRCGSDEGFDYMGGCFTCLDVGGQELPLEEEEDDFEAAVLHKKPKGYVGKAVAIDNLMTQARIEEAMLQLETAVKLGLISEDEIMKQLQEHFGSEEYAGNYMVPADVKSLARSVKVLQSKARADQNQPEWWKSKLSVVAAELDDLTDFFDYAEDTGML